MTETTAFSEEVFSIAKSSNDFVVNVAGIKITRVDFIIFMHGQKNEKFMKLIAGYFQGIGFGKNEMYVYINDFILYLMGRDRASSIGGSILEIEYESYLQDLYLLLLTTYEGLELFMSSNDDDNLFYILGVKICDICIDKNFSESGRNLRKEIVNLNIAETIVKNSLNKLKMKTEQDVRLYGIV